LFRIRVVTRDERDAAITVQIDDHPREARPYVLNDIADRLRVERSAVLDVLASWSREQLVTHLQQFTHEELKPPALRR
jgi:hypothetical protein